MQALAQGFLTDLIFSVPDSNSLQQTNLDPKLNCAPRQSGDNR